MSAPDILWIVTTQWRAQACGYAGDPNAHTPALDALAADPRTAEPRRHTLAFDKRACSARNGVKCQRMTASVCRA
jgi:hypothetical protein